MRLIGSDVRMRMQTFLAIILTVSEGFVLIQRLVWCTLETLLQCLASAPIFEMITVDRETRGKPLISSGTLGVSPVALRGVGHRHRTFRQQPVAGY